MHGDALLISVLVERAVAKVCGCGSAKAGSKPPAEGWNRWGGDLLGLFLVGPSESLLMLLLRSSNMASFVERAP